MLDTILMTFGGVLLGIGTGLIPGVHVNLVATATLSLGAGASAAPLLVSLAITHSFLSTIPAVLLGAPESETALGVLPGHRYVLRGLGYMAIKLTLVGSYFGLLIALLLIPVWWSIIQLYPHLTRVMGYVLLAVSAYMILRDRHKAWSLTVYLLSGALGWLLLHRDVVSEPLFPLFSGLFGTATLLYSLHGDSTPPPQRIENRIDVRASDGIRALLAGNAAGFLTSMLPGLGAAQAAVLGMHLARKVGDHGFLILLGTISTVNFALSLLTWLALDKARNGAVVAVQQLIPSSTAAVLLLLTVALIAGSLSVPLCLLLSRGAVRVVTRVNYAQLCMGVILLIVVLVGVITGWRGLAVLVVATGLGLVPAVVRCSRAHAMGCLMLPVALFFL